MNIPLNI